MRDSAQCVKVCNARSSIYRLKEEPFSVTMKFVPLHSSDRLYSECTQLMYSKRVKVSPIYDSVRWGGGRLIERTLILSRRYSKVGWPVPFLAALTSPVLPSGTHLLMGGK